MEINISRTTEQSECRTKSRFQLAKELFDTDDIINYLKENHK